MRQPLAAALAVAVFAIAAPALGQREAPISFDVGGGVTFPLGGLSNRFQTGGDFTAGLAYTFNRRWTVQLDYLYSGYTVQPGLVPDTQLSARHTMQYGTLDVLFNVVAPPSDWIGVYLVGGPGLYYRRVNITRFEGTVIAPFCDPFLLTCTSGPVPVSTLVGSASSTDFGLNVGAGVAFKLAAPIRLFLESRYHYVFGPTFQTASGESKTANGQYVPLVLGIRLP